MMIYVFQHCFRYSNVKFTVYPEAGHDSWTESYANPELYEWLLQQKRPAK